MKYNTTHPMSTLVKLWQKVDVFKRFYDGERNVFWDKEDLLGIQHLLEILQISLTFKNSEKVVNSGCFKKLLRWGAPIFFRNDGGI